MLVSCQKDEKLKSLDTFSNPASITGTLTNLCFFGTNSKQLFVTTHNEVYVLKLTNN
jgi:hypothetical protein